MARQFDDAQLQYLYYDTSLGLSKPLTMAAWFKTDDLTINQTIMALGSDNASYPSDCILLNFRGADAGDYLHARENGTTTATAPSTASVQSGVWHHGVGVFTSNTDRCVYLDGGNKGSVTTDCGETPQISNFEIGAVKYNNGSTQVLSYWSGALAHVAVWSAALTDDEAAALARGADPRVIRPGSLVAYFPLVRTDQDIVGGYDVSPQNTPTWTDDPGKLFGVAPVYAARAGSGSQGSGLVLTAEQVSDYIHLQWGEVAGWLTGWDYRRPVTVNNNTGSSNLEWYPIKVTLNNTNFTFSHAETDGSDIRVTDDDGQTVIPYYIRSYSSAGQTAEIWVRVPYIQAGTTKTLYVYCSNGSAASFLLPPTGTFEHPSSAVVTDGLFENMVYDDVTEKYYIVYSSSGSIVLLSSASPEGSWSSEGTILSPGASGWDDQSVNSPCLLKDGSTWYLYYGGQPSTPGNGDLCQIGYATASSVTGTYTKYGSNPVLSYGASGSWEEYRVLEPYVYYSDILSKWVMLYMGDMGSGSTSELEQVGYATADAVTGPWTKFGNNPVLAFGQPASAAYQLLADPWAVEIDGVAYIGYCGGTVTRWTQEMMATTEDYQTFRDYGSVYSGGVIGEWDYKSAIRGAVLLVGNYWYMPYAMYDPGVATRSAVTRMYAYSTAKGYDPLCVLDFLDDFDGAALDSDLWGIYNAEAEGSVSVSSSVATIAVTGSNGQEQIDGRRLFGVPVLVEVYCRRDTVAADTTRMRQIGLGHEDLNPRVCILDYNSSYFQKISQTEGGSQSSVSMAQETGTLWMTHRIKWLDSTKVSYQIDNNSWEDITTGVADYSSHPHIRVARSGNDTTLYVDWLLVRKYAGYDPTVSVGAEE